MVPQTLAHSLGTSRLCHLLCSMLCVAQAAQHWGTPGRGCRKGAVQSGVLGLDTNGSVLPSQEYGVPFMETSAKTGMNVELAFLAIAR